ncbi:DUF805 domain-containing protein [Mangrovibacter phragmitis]|uniref:DUF805 domain-containing protein n=1 Tax=Mangrovibacter phragmitis TaxID=1691903 RepID=UPI00336A0820
MRILKALKKGIFSTFSYEGRDTRFEYGVVFIFQYQWYFGWLRLSSAEDTSIILLLCFILPLLDSAVRRINDAGYSRFVIILLVFFPYILFPFLLLPASVNTSK